MKARLARHSRRVSPRLVRARFDPEAFGNPNVLGQVHSRELGRCTMGYKFIHKEEWSSSLVARKSTLKVSKWSVPGSNPGSCTYSAMSLPTELSSRGQGL
ncbi:hypothetical protein L195_g041865, partial [Trifolium pratense]